MKYDKKYYPDGSFYVEVTDFTLEFNFEVNSYSDLWTLNQIVDVYNHNNLRPIVTIPCLLDAQADRRFKHNQPHSLKLVLGFLNNLKADFIVFHPHNSEVVEALLDNVVIIDNSDFIKKVLKEVDTSNLVLMSSDAGGFKPLMKLCENIYWEGEVYSASKSRSYINGISKLIQQIDRQDFGGKDILIIDDICVKGGTFLGLSKMLKERNIGKIYLAVSHLTLPVISKELSDSFDMIFTSDSKGFTEYKIEGSGHDRLLPTTNNKITIIEL